MDSALDLIIDCIENNHLKKALELCEKGLKRWPGNTQLVALKSLALWYSGQESQAKALVLVAANNQPNDHFTISIMERVLEYSENYELLASVCETALKSDYDFRVAEKLYFSYIKLQSTKKLYSIASKLFNMTRNQIYLYWAILGLVLESRGLDQKDRSIISELSKRTLKKIDCSIADPKLVSEFKNLNVAICDIAHDFSGLLEALQLDPNNNASDYLRLEIEANMKIGNFEAAKSICLSYFRSHGFIDSNIWTLFLETLCKLENGFSAAYDLIELSANNFDTRGLKCAALELKIKCNDAYQKSAAEMLFDFCIELNQKPSTFNDVVFFLKKMDVDEVNDFYSKISAFINSASSSGDLMGKLLYLHLHRYLALTLKLENGLSDNSKKYVDILYAEMDALSSGTENYHSLALYRCLLLIDNYVSGSNTDLSSVFNTLEKYSSLFVDSYVFGMLKIVVALHNGKSTSITQLSSNFIGCFYRARLNFKNLEIKCLQLDTLGYLLSDHALNLLSFSEWESLYAESSSLYASNRRDTWGLIYQSLENQSFSSVIDFYEFSERLERSIQHISHESNHIKLNILKLPMPDMLKILATDKFSRSLEIISFASGHIYDNRDFRIFDTIDAAGNLKEMIAQLKKFSIEEAAFYYLLSNFILCTSIEKIKFRDFAFKNPYYVSMKKIIFELSNESEFSLEINNLLYASVLDWKASMELLRSLPVDYRHYYLLSDFCFKFKEIFTVSVLKLRGVKVENIRDHPLLLKLESVLLELNPVLKGVISSFNNVSDELSTSIVNFNQVLEDLQKFIL